MAEEDRRAERYRFAGLLVPLLALCCAVIVLLVVLGVADLAYSLATQERLFASGPAAMTSNSSAAEIAANPAAAAAAAGARNAGQSADQ